MGLFGGFSCLYNGMQSKNTGLSGNKIGSFLVESMPVQQSDYRPTQRPRTQAPAAKRHKPAQKKGKGRIKALDGLRAVAIIGVVLFHMRPSALEGGFLGVTLFFVLTGYFITRSILRGLDKTGEFSYVDYLKKRVRRLLPPIIVAIAFAAILIFAMSPALLPKVQADALPSVLFFSNWSYIFRNVSYFAAAGLPSPLTHLWFTGVTMQFYVLWPILLMLLTCLFRTRKGLLTGVGVMMAASVLAMALLFDPNADTARVYYGTDARAAELLSGAFLAIAFDSLEHFILGGNKRMAVAKANVISAVCLILLIVGFVFANGQDAWLYRGGYLAVAVMCCLLVLTVQQPGCIVSKILSCKPLVYLGGRSFSIYLIHYPILTVLNPATRTTPLEWWEWALGFVVILLLSEVFYRFVEQPFTRKAPKKHAVAKAEEGRPAARSMANRGAQQSSRETSPVRCAAFVHSLSDTRAANIATVVSTVLVVLLIVLPFDWQAISQARAQELRPELAQSASSNQEAQQDNAASEPAEQSEAGQSGALSPQAEKVPDNLNASAWTYDAEKGTCNADVLIIGDSVGDGASKQIKKYLPDAWLDAKVSRQLSVGPDVYRDAVSEGWNGSAVIVELGGNSLIRDKSIVQKMIDAVGGKPMYFVTIRCPYPLQDANNQILRDYAAQNSNVGIIDWYGESEGHSEYLVDDGQHLTDDGCEAFAKLFRKALCGQ